MAATRAHLLLIEHLRAVTPKSWSTQALLSCLTRLAAGGPTEGHLVKVHDGWPTNDGTDGVCVIYSQPGTRRVGVRVLRTSSADHPLYLNAHGGADLDDARDFGIEVADYVIGEPLGVVSSELTNDAAGVGWWGEPPFPSNAQPVLPA